MGGKTVHVFTSSGVLKNPSGSPITNKTILWSVVEAVVKVSSNESGGSAGGGAGGLISSHPDVPTRRGSQITIPTSDMTVVVGSGGGGALVVPGNPGLR